MTGGRRLEGVRRWLRYAREDLWLAERIAAQGIDAPRFACFHAQQAAEKTLKAALIFESIRPPREHSLDVLRDQLPATWKIKVEQPDLRVLSEWAVEVRYPGDAPDATARDAELGVLQARAIWRSITDQLYDRGFDANAAHQ